MQKASSWATVWPPVSLGILAQIARSFGPVRLIDGNVERWTRHKLLKDIGNFQPNLLLINTGFPSINTDMSVARSIKEAFPHIPLIGIGVYFTLLEAQGLQEHPYLDFCIYGEPEDTFYETLQALASGAKDIEKIKGLIFRKERCIHVNPRRPLKQDLDSIPHPARDLFKNERYRLPHNGKKYTLINVGRGCPYSCSYCIVAPHYGKNSRRHSVNYILSEINECQQQYGIEEFLFWDEIFTLDRNFTLKLCHAIIDNRLKISWAATTRVDLLDHDLLFTMKEAGCSLLGLGIESGCQKILDNAGKGQTLGQVRSCVEQVQKVGIKTMGHFIFGLPGETVETAEQTIKFMLELDLDFMQSYCAVPYPGTKFGEQARQMGWIKTNQWSHYDFGGKSIIDSTTMNSEQITYFREKAFKKFYYRPTYILRIIRSHPFRQLLKMASFSGWISANKRK